MPPHDSQPASTIRYLTRLLCALADKSPKCELRIEKAKLDQLAGEGSYRALFEDFDTKTEEVVLRFRPKSLATYLIEENQCQTREQKSSDQLPLTNSAKSSTTQSRLPLTDQQLAQIEKKVAQEKRLREIRRERQASSNPLEGIL